MKKNMKNMEDIANLYDEADLAKEFDFSKARVKKAKIKRVNMQIPFELYLEALKIGKNSGTGYQNAMKMAMFVGFNYLEHKKAAKN